MASKVIHRDPRKVLIAAVTFLAGLYFFLEYLLPEQIGTFKFGQYHEQINRAIQAVGVMGIGLGLINIFSVHGSSILLNRPGWLNSLVLILAMCGMFLIQSFDYANSQASINIWKPISVLQKFSDDIAAKNAADPKAAATRIAFMAPVVAKAIEQSTQAYPATDETAIGAMKAQVLAKLAATQSRIDAAQTTLNANPSADAFKAALAEVRTSLKESEEVMRGYTKAVYESTRMRGVQRVMYEGLFVSLGTAMFSLLAFYIATAAYRTFRIRSWEAAVMMAAALLVMLGQMSHGPIYISEHLPALRRWFLQYLNTPAFRAIYFGSMLAGLGMAVRMWLSLERNILSVDSDDAGDEPGKTGGSQ